MKQREEGELVKTRGEKIDKEDDRMISGLVKQQ